MLFRIGLFWGKILLLYEVKGHSYPPLTDDRQPTQRRRTRPCNVKRFYMIHHLSAYKNPPCRQKHILQPTHVTWQAGKSLHMYALKLGVFYC